MDAPIDAVQAACHADPYPWYAGLRAAHPLAFDARLGLWVAADAAGVQEALSHPALRVRPPAEPVPAALQGRPAGAVFGQLVRMNDGAFHRQHRPWVADTARGWSAGLAAGAGRAAALQLGDHCPPDALLTAVPVRAIARLLGVADAALDATTAQVHAFTQGLTAGADAQALDAADHAAQALLAQGRAQGLAEVHAANRIALMQQALDATAGLIGNTVHLLQVRPAWRALAATDDGMAAIVAEVARWDAPIQNTRRFAAQPVTLGGEHIAAGQGVLLLLASANRDPALNDAPDVVDPARRQRRSLTFGAGAHACPGEHLAIAIAAAALRALDGQRPLAQRFGPVRGYRPLPNARIPVFAP